MRSKRENFYDDDGRLTGRGVKAVTPLTGPFSRLLKKASTPRECMELELAAQSHLGVSVSIRILNLQSARMSGKKGHRGRGR